jgi:hypothetical protein
MSEKSIIMSLSVKSEMQDLLKVSAKNTGKSVSELIRTLVDKCLPLVVQEGNEIPVILKIPVELKHDETGLRDWLTAKMEAIVKKIVTKP